MTVMDVVEKENNYPLVEPVPVIPEFPSWTPLLIMLVAVAALSIFIDENYTIKICWIKARVIPEQIDF